MGKLKFTIAGLTDLGKVRTNNEDAVWVDPQNGLLIVADGMGGHSSGEVASGIAIRSIPENFNLLAQASDAVEKLGTTVSDDTNRLGTCVKMANRMIHEAAQKKAEDKGMGTTCTAALIEDGRIGLAHVGDSRAYLFRRGEMQQLTNDHSLVADQVRQGIISKEEAAKSSMQNILTRALGPQADVEVDVDEHPLFPGDIVLLCSDGLFKDMTEDEIHKTVEEVPEPQPLVQKLVERANAAGGRDNVTVAVARLEEPSFGEKLKSLFSIFSK